LPKFGPSPPLEFLISVFCLLFAIAVDLQALNRLRLDYLAKFAAAKNVRKVKEILETIIIKTTIETAVEMEKIEIKTAIVEAQFLYSKEIKEANLANLEEIQLLHLTI